MLPSADKLSGVADFIFLQDLAPVHPAKADLMILVFLFSVDLNFPDLNAIENLQSIVKRNLRHQTQHCRWPGDSCQSSLGFHHTFAKPQPYPLCRTA